MTKKKGLPNNTTYTSTPEYDVYERINQKDRDRIKAFLLLLLAIGVAVVIIAATIIGALSSG